MESNVAFLNRVIEGRDWRLDQAEARLSVASKNQDRLRFLQAEGFAWPNDYIDRHMKICADKRSHVPSP